MLPHALQGEKRNCNRYPAPFLVIAGCCMAKLEISPRFILAECRVSLNRIGQYPNGIDARTDDIALFQKAWWREPDTHACGGARGNDVA